MGFSCTFIVEQINEMLCSGLNWKNEIQSNSEMARFSTVVFVYAVHDLLCKKQTSIESKQEHRPCELINNYLNHEFYFVQYSPESYRPDYR